MATISIQGAPTPNGHRVTTSLRLVNVCIAFIALIVSGSADILFPLFASMGWFVSSIVLILDELRQYWKERSERILRNYEAGRYDENNKAMMASVSWARLSMEEKEEGYKKYYFMFDRWQAEADAMCGYDEDDED